MRLWPTRIAYAVCVVITIAIAAKVARTELAEPPPFAQADLQNWLLAVEPDPTVVIERRAARQLDRDFHASFDWQPYFNTLAADQQTVFVANWQRLLLVLLEQRADAHRALPGRHRERFLDGQLADLQTWYIVGPYGRSTGLSLFSQLLMAASSSQSSTGTSAKISEFLSALQARVVQRSLNRVMPGEKEPANHRDD